MATELPDLDLKVSRPRLGYHRLMLTLVLILALLPLSTVAQVESKNRVGAGAAATELPEQLREVGFDQRLGAQVPLDVEFLDEKGNVVTLGDYVQERPVILAPVYYECPMLCQLILSGISGSLKGLAFNVGTEFDVVTVSFDPDETPEIAAAAKERTLSRYGRPDTEGGWHFLTGEQEAIQQVTEAIGFSYTYDPERDEFAHSAGIVVLTKEGKAARYLYGVEYAPRDLRLALVEAADNQIGSLVDSVLLFCFHYDPATGKYSTAVLNLIRLGGVITVLVIGFLMVATFRRDKKQSALRTV